MSISLVGQAGVSGGDYTSPNVFTYASTRGNALIFIGHFYSTGGPDYPTSITDSAGNTWQISTTSAQNPPTALNSIGAWQCNFIAWCLNANAVTSVTVSCEDASSIWWRCTLTEWSGIAQFDNSWSGTGASDTSFTLGPVALHNAGELVVGSASPLNGSQSEPVDFTDFSSSAGQTNGYSMPGITGPYSPVYTTTSAGVWSGVLAVFSPVSPVSQSALLALLP